MKTAEDGNMEQPSGAGSPAGGPRNYLSGRERRRIFWLFMPPAVVAVLVLGWVERRWFAPATPPPAPRIDTRLRTAEEPALEPGDVRIDQQRAPAVAVRPAESLSAGPEQLAAIDDDSVFGAAERPAWVQTFLTLRSADPRGLREAARPVTFGEIFGQPESFRGRPVRFKGTLRGLERRPAPANEYGFEHYWQSWIEPADGAAAPIMVHSLEIPAGMQPGMKLDAPVEVVGYFLKNTAYLARDRQMHRAPLVLAFSLEPRPGPAVVSDWGAWLVSMVFATLAAVAVAVVLGFGLSAAGGRARRPEPTADLDATLAGADVVTTSEALERLAAAERAATWNHRIDAMDQRRSEPSPESMP